MTVILCYSNRSSYRILNLHSYTQLLLLVFLEILHIWSSWNVEHNKTVSRNWSLITWMVSWVTTIKGFHIGSYSTDYEFMKFCFILCKVRFVLWYLDYKTRPDWSWSACSHLHDVYQVIPWGKRSGAWPEPHDPYSAQVQERIDLYLHSATVASW